jgi:CspA family cold shock protein
MVNGKKGYGFIERDDKEKDAFVARFSSKSSWDEFLNDDKLSLH